MKNKVFSNIMLTVGTILGLESLIYFMLYALLPLLYAKLNIFEYSLTILQFDFNKIWIGFICYSIFMNLNESKKSTIKFFEIIYYVIYLFIGSNVLISSIIFFYYRLGKVVITDIFAIQKYFGTFIYIIYALVILAVTGIHLYNKKIKNNLSIQNEEAIL